MISFEDNVREIVGLTSYEEGELPRWFREDLQYYYGVGQIDDAELLCKINRSEWLGHWGIAVVNGEEVAILEHLCDGAEDLDTIAELAYRLTCGYVVVEQSQERPSGWTVYMTELFCVTPRPRVATLATVG